MVQFRIRHVLWITLFAALVFRWQSLEQALRAQLDELEQERNLIDHERRTELGRFALEMLRANGQQIETDLQGVRIKHCYRPMEGSGPALERVVHLHEVRWGGALSLWDAAALARSPTLRTLTVALESTTPLSAGSLAELGSSRSLEELTIAGNLEAAADFHSLSKLRRLRAVRVIASRLTSRQLDSLRSLSGLKSLSLSCQSLTNEDLSHLAVPTGLETLNLSAPGLTDACVPALQNLTNLKELKLRGAGLSPTGIQELRGRSNAVILIEE